MSATPRETFNIIGHEAAELPFRDALAHGRMHHAWLLSGPAGIGKATLAFRLARILLNATDPQRAAGRRVTAGTHADLLVIERKTDEKRGRLRGEIVADDVRPIQSFLRRTAAEGGWRVVIVDGAEFLNRHAANALLKLLEEPPPQTVLLLTTSSPGALLPTIRSRCRSLVLSPLSENDMRAVLAEQGYDAAEWPRLIAQAQGAPGRAEFLGRDRNGEMARLAQAWLGGAARDVTPSVADQVARQEDGFALLCDLLGKELSGRARALALQNKISLAAKAAAAFSELAALRRETERFNLDKAQAVEQAAAIVSEL
ncbi:DNA polymerase III subunit delta' [Kozakia baliensis]|uniref:DNA polymerase III subunit delta' n=1 Tax=Kozakia baliensis TaxID=153496 RepID=UPI00087C75BB|nr:DNA polymerase III subunit delta' [Kozakia baliensis]AOX19739.1 DNA polymerase III subunit delta' [Kozakia baliensis]